MSFPKTVNQMGSFGQIRKNPLFRFCRPILDIFGFTLLSNYFLCKATTGIQSHDHCNAIDTQGAVQLLLRPQVTHSISYIYSVTYSICRLSEPNEIINFD